MVMIATKKTKTHHTSYQKFEKGANHKGLFCDDHTNMLGVYMYIDVLFAEI